VFFVFSFATFVVKRVAEQLQTENCSEEILWRSKTKPS